MQAEDRCLPPLRKCTLNQLSCLASACNPILPIGRREFQDQLFRGFPSTQKPGSWGLLLRCMTDLTLITMQIARRQPDLIYTQHNFAADDFPCLRLMNFQSDREGVGAIIPATIARPAPALPLTFMP